ncbi:MAG: hypothetical protein JMDDDDMK_05390 [Acidobacteria bacterium]|nr:hypothetical protein [Acidobacteriota bacterium]
MAQQFDHVRTHPRSDFQPDAETEAAIAHLLFDVFEQIARLILFDFDVGVARDAERLTFDDAHSGKERFDVRRHHLFEHHETITFASDWNQPGHIRRQFDAGEARFILLVLRLFRDDQDAQVHADVRDVRERMARINRKRRENGKDAFVEKTAQFFALLLAQFAVRDDSHAVWFQPRQNLF